MSFHPFTRVVSYDFRLKWLEKWYGDGDGDALSRCSFSFFRNKLFNCERYIKHYDPLDKLMWGEG